jgi:dihydroorotate dehydrogenase
VVGANLGANKDSADRIGDYVTGLQRLWGLASYFTVNISSPNTPGLRDLQSEAALQELAGRLAEARAALRAQGPDAPVFLKVAPDIAEASVPGVVATVRANGMDGVIVSNTTITRPEGLRSAHRGEAGGLSGAPLLSLSTRMLARFHEADPTLPLIGVGGIASGADAYAKIRAGASAVQLYSALVFEGPGLIPRIKAELAARLTADGFRSVAEACGA